MAVVWILEWDGITPEQYEDLKSRVDWDGEPPAGLQHQVTAFSDKALILTQLWQSPDHVLRFMEDRLLPAIREMGINSMPRVDQYRVHSVFSAEG
ncbi:MAG TPA: hypothetical protein VJB57_17970 [Dehalococcoidia bacterium]|nr:hypothetical protein [Dehalococcoidia bacterium]